MNYRLASMIENVRHEEYTSHIAWLLRLEIIAILEDRK